MINVHFSKPDVLAYFVWITLAWFTYRYWINHKSSWKEGYYNEINSQICSKVCYRYMLKKFDLTDNYENSYYPDRHWVQICGDPHRRTILFRHIYKLEGGQQKSDTKDMESIADKFMLFLCTLILFLKEPSLSTYFMPYSFVLTAAVFGVNSSL